VHKGIFFFFRAGEVTSLLPVARELMKINYFYYMKNIFSQRANRKCKINMKEIHMKVLTLSLIFITILQSSIGETDKSVLWNI
jgi:type III secretory pathway component EscU